MNCFNNTYNQLHTNTTNGGIGLISPSSGKEKDSETGLSYFGARYYESEMLNIWLGVGSMADKYPNLSPYNYWAWTRPTGGDEHRWIKYNIVNNPIKLMDPDGMEVEYSSVGDRIRVSIARLVSKNFNSNYKILKASEETYVFRGASEKELGGRGGEFTTYGEKLLTNIKPEKLDIVGPFI